MTPKERLVCALDGQKPDRLPVTTHHVMKYFLDKYLEGMTSEQFFEKFGLDAIRWLVPSKPDESKGQRFVETDPSDPWHDKFIVTDQWQIEWDDVPGLQYPTTRYTITTPGGTLTTCLASNEYTHWVTEHLIKQKSDIELIGKYVPGYHCDVDEVNRNAEQFGDKGIIRGHIPSFDIFGQPGCWQDAACLFGIEPLIMMTYDDPGWVHELLSILRDRKVEFVKSLEGAEYDVLELGGGDASSTVISPKLLEEYVLPYDAEIIEHAHRAGQRIAYHTCGGMMPILELLASMKPDAMETFTPSEMGGDVDLAQARKRLGSDICMIGGFDQFHFFKDCTPEQTRRKVRDCFEQAGSDGAYIICPSDHFFDADLELIEAFADEAKKCTY